MATERVAPPRRVVPHRATDCAIDVYAIDV
jgi:hypothetical protein